MDMGYKVFIILWAISALVGTAIFVGVIYVAIHFLAKIW